VNNPNPATTGEPAAQRTGASPVESEIVLLRHRVEFQRLLGEVSTQFINLPAEEIDGHINQVLGRIGSFLGFNLAAISKFSGQGSAGEITHIWTATGLPPVPPGFTELDFPWVAGRLTQDQPVHLATLDDLPQPEGQRDRQTFEHIGIRSAYNWPLKVGGTVMGNLGLASIGSAHPFPAEFEEELALLAQILASGCAGYFRKTESAERVLAAIRKAVRSVERRPGGAPSQSKAIDPEPNQ